MHPGLLIPGGLEDTQLFLWNAWWGHFVGGIGRAYETTYLFHPYGVSLITHDMPLWMLAITNAAQAFHFSLIQSVDLWFVFTWALNGFCMYLLAREVARHQAPALVAGLFVMTHAYTLARAMENWGQFNIYGLPLFLWLLQRARASTTMLSPWSVAAGVALAWTAACHYYFFIYALLVWAAVMAWDHCPWTLDGVAVSTLNWKKYTGIGLMLIGGTIAAWIMVLHPGQWTFHHHVIGLESPANALLIFWIGTFLFIMASRQFLIRARVQRSTQTFFSSPHLVIGCFAFLFLLPLLWKAVPLMFHGDYPHQHILWKTHLPGANLCALIAPNPLHALWGKTVSAWFVNAGLNPQEEASMIGWTCLIVVLWSAVWRRDQRIKRWLVLACGATLLSMGVYLHVWTLNLWCPLPFYVTRLLPLLENVRVPERWMALGTVAWAVVFASALIVLAQKKSWALNRLCVLAGAAVLFENWPGIPYVSPPPLSSVYQVLRQQPPGAVLPVPLYIGDSSVGEGDLTPSAHNFPWEHLWAQTQYEKPMVGGYIGRIPRRIMKAYAQDPYWGELLRLEEGAPASHPGPSAQERRNAVQKAQIRYCLLYPSAIPPAALSFIRRTLRLEPLASEGDVQLYRITN